jgi:hypothetical protein
VYPPLSDAEHGRSVVAGVKGLFEDFVESDEFFTAVSDDKALTFIATHSAPYRCKWFIESLNALKSQVFNKTGNVRITQH